MPTGDNRRLPAQARAEQALQLLMAAQHDGLTYAQLCQAMGVTDNTTRNAMGCLRQANRAQMRWKGGRYEARWYATPYAPQAGTPGRALTVKAAPNASNASKPGPKGRNPARLDMGAEVIVPPHVQVQVCPCGKDTRYTVDPRIAGRGAITQDWRARRLAEQKAGHA